MAMDEKGYIPVYFGMKAKDGPDKDHYITDVKIGKESVFSLRDVVVWVPGTDAAAAAAFSGFKFSAVEPDGTEHASVGVLAAASAKYMHALETPRGAIRARAVKLQKDGKSLPEIRAALTANTESYRASFENFRIAGGGERAGGSKIVPLSDAEFTKAAADGTLKALLMARGMM
jgi:hypothetical protein